MDKESIDRLNKLILNFLLVLGIAYASLQIVFYKEKPWIVLRYVVNIIYLYTLPGYFLISALIKDMDFAEKIVIGTGIGLGVTSILSYYLGLFHLGFIVQIILLPLFIIGISLLIRRLK